MVPIQNVLKPIYIHQGAWTGYV